MRNRTAAAIGLAGIGLAAASAGAGQEYGPPMLGRLESGQWELRAPTNARIASICLGNPILLTQPLQAPGPCARDVIAADETSVTVNYVCPGVGRGRTTIRFETPRLVQIESQGLDHGMPFALRAEARKVGPCA